jgi:hypothetical protein
LRRAAVPNLRRCRNPIIANKDNNEIASNAPPPPPPPPPVEVGGLDAMTCAIDWADFGPDEQVMV